MKTRPRTLDNASIAELLALESEQASGNAGRALRRASRRAFTWEKEASDLLEHELPLTELAGVGPFIARILKDWIEGQTGSPKPPPLRSGFLTISQTKAILSNSKSKPFLKELKGDLQMHSTWSDGYASISEFAEAAGEFGHQYIAITDHSKGLKIAGGIDEAQLKRQAREIDALNRRQVKEGGPVILKSIEMNISPDGQGDMEPDALLALDIVLGAFHSKLRYKDDQTDRYIKALENPYVHVLAHPRGRIYNFRLGLSADWQEVFEAAAALGKAVEIDAFPDRQDLDVSLLRIAAAQGTMVSIGTDSHHPHQLPWIELGLAAAVKAGVKKENILNLMDVEQLRLWTSALKEKAPSM
jgi:histidinol phosphatase-like PHP family hydrolase